MNSASLPPPLFSEGLQLHQTMLVCDWQGYESALENLRQQVYAGQPASKPFSFLTFPTTAAEQLQVTQDYASRVFPPRPPAWRGQVYRHDKIRVAYLSADYHEHATSYLTAGLFEGHDRSAFEIYGISYGRTDDSPVRKRLVNAFESFIDVSVMSDDQVAGFLADKQIDIAVDLKGYTQGARPGIFAHRFAPIQVNYLGYPGTMGVPFIDYVIADAIVIPPEHQSFYSEKVAWLPFSYQVNDRARMIAEHIPSRVECGLPDDAFVFCCFNNPYKITPDIFDIWMRLLRDVPGSVLWLYERNPESSHNLRREAAARSVSPDRLVFARKMPLADHLARHKNADLFLDTLPYNAHTTASDALWAGLPLLTCQGGTFAGRVAASLLTAAGLPEMITTSLDDYETRARELARDQNKLTEMEEKLQSNLLTCPLFDTALSVSHIEAAYKTMWRRYQEGVPPVSFSVSR